MADIDSSTFPVVTTPTGTFYFLGYDGGASDPANRVAHTAMRNLIGLGTTDSPTFASLTTTGQISADSVQATDVFASNALGIGQAEINEAEVEYIASFAGAADAAARRALIGAAKDDLTESAQRIALGSGDDQIIQGREYLYALYNKLIARTAVVGVASGDSTIAGDATTTPYRLWEVIPALGAAAGYYGIACANRGQSGVTSYGWTTTYLAGDLALTPDLLILRWGLNDPNGVRGDQGNADLTIANMRAGLTTIRAARTVAQTSIVLMMVNSCTDDPAWRTTGYFRALRIGLQQAARDFKCAFFDTYQLLRDSSFGGWINEDYSGGSGRYVHPLNVGNAIIGRALSDLLFPAGLAYSAPSALTMIASWVDWGSGVVGAAKYARLGNGDVRLSGVVKGGTYTNDTLITTLAAGFRPAYERWFLVPAAVDATSTNMSFATIIVKTSGQIRLFNCPGNYYLSLDNIVFSTIA